MMRHQIEVLLKSVPAQNAFFDDSKKHSPLEIRARCIDDPAFCWKFVRTFVEARKQLPKGCPPVMLRAYDHVTGAPRDVSIEAAIAITYPGQEYVRAVLEATLLCSALDEQPVDDDLPMPGACVGSIRGPRAKSPLRPLPFETIAGHIGVAVEVVRDFENLFFNLRDRFNEKAYIGQLVYPQSRLATLAEEFHQQTSFGQKLRIAGYEKGLNEVLMMAGLVRDPASGINADQLTRDVEETLLQKGLMALKYGDLDSPIVAGLLKYIANREKTEHLSDDMRAGLSGVSMKYQIEEMIMAGQRDEVAYRLALQAADLQANKDLKIGPSDKSEIHINYEDSK